MSSIEEFCTEVLILNRGKTVLKGNLKEIKDMYPANRIMLSTKENVDKYIKEANLEIYNNVNNEYEIKVNSEEQGYKLFDILAKNNVKVLKFEIKKPSLNDIFIEKVGEQFERFINSCNVYCKRYGKKKVFYNFKFNNINIDSYWI